MKCECCLYYKGINFINEYMICDFCTNELIKIMNSEFNYKILYKNKESKIICLENYLDYHNSYFYFSKIRIKLYDNIINKNNIFNEYKKFKFGCCECCNMFNVLVYKSDYLKDKLCKECLNLMMLELINIYNLKSNYFDNNGFVKIKFLENIFKKSFNLYYENIFNIVQNKRWESHPYLSIDF